MTLAGTAPRSTGIRLRWVALVVGLVLAALVAVLATRPNAEKTLAHSPLLDKPAPALAGPGLDGRPVSLASLSGHFVLVNFFASWCEPCHQEMPALRQIARSGVSVLGVTFTDSASSAAAFLRSEGATWPAIVDGNEHLAVDWGVRGPPEAFLVSPEGVVIAKFDGPVPATGAQGVLGLVTAARRAGS